MHFLYLIPLALLISCKLNRSFNSLRESDGDSSPEIIGHYSTSTPYYPPSEKETSAFDPVPEGFKPVFFQLVSRHSSRGLTKRSSDAIIYNATKMAKAENMLTPLGESLLKDVEDLMRVNTCLGRGILEKGKEGYGNLSKHGTIEHKEFGARTYNRMKSLFDEALSQQAAEKKRPILVVTSGVDRAVDSSEHFKKGFVEASGGRAEASLQTPKGVGPKPKDGVNRYLLYFHALKEEDDSTEDPVFKEIFDASQAYQRFKSPQEAKTEANNPPEVAKLTETGSGSGSIPKVDDKVKEIRKANKSDEVARRVLAKIFKEDFLAKIEAKQVSINNTVENFEAKDKNGEICNFEPKEDDKKTISSLDDLAKNLYSLYAIAPALKHELDGKNFDEYFPKEDAKIFEFLDSADEFYKKGPSMTEANQVTHKIAKLLVKDFFDQVDQVITKLQSGSPAPAGVLRFAHAETIMPFAANFGVPRYSKSLPASENISPENNQWQNSRVSPFMANFQWEVYMNDKKTVLVRMLQNEREVAFLEACNGARHEGSKFLYDFAKLKQCHPGAGSGGSGSGGKGEGGDANAESEKPREESSTSEKPRE